MVIENENAAEVMRFALVSENAKRVDGEILHAGTDKWLTVSKDWIAVTTGQSVELVGHQSPLLQENKTFMCEIPDDNKGGGVSTPSFIPTFSTFSTPRQLDWMRADKAIIAYCFEKAGVDSDLPLPWKLLNEARALHRVGQFRRTVIDASSAAEVVGYQLLATELARTTPPGIAKHLMEKGNLTLGTIISLLQAAGVPTHADLSQKLVGLRNKALHANKGAGPHEPTESESKRAIALATELVKQGCPLPLDIPAIHGKPTPAGQVGP